MITDLALSSAFDSVDVTSGHSALSRAMPVVGMTCPCLNTSRLVTARKCTVAVGEICRPSTDRNDKALPGMHGCTVTYHRRPLPHHTCNVATHHYVVRTYSVLQQHDRLRGFPTQTQDGLWGGFRLWQALIGQLRSALAGLSRR